ncbi:hypothetical protein VNO77_03970 [Canavalia gladiata]|uniref:Uncharacterized protein n=1 Tax=Canavalia gladiata TaxID=3824 RepID=A0AAN9R7B8_CANGL
MYKKRSLTVTKLQGTTHPSGLTLEFQDKNECSQYNFHINPGIRSDKSSDTQSFAKLSSWFEIPDLLTPMFISQIILWP